MDHAPGSDDDGLTAAIVAIVIAGVAVKPPASAGAAERASAASEVRSFMGNLHPSLFPS